MVMHHPKVRGVLVVEHGDQAGVLLDELAFPVLYPGAADLLQSSGEAFEPGEAVQLQVGIDRLQASNRNDAAPLSDGQTFSARASTAAGAATTSRGSTVGLVLSSRRHARAWA